MLQGIRNKIYDKWLGNRANDIISWIELAIMKRFHSKEIIKLLSKLIREDKPFLLKPYELFMVYSLAKRQIDLNGDYAEVGVFKGTTAKAICEAKGDKKLYLFDTFEGLPEPSKFDKNFKKQMFDSEVSYVMKKLSKYPNVFIYKGLFTDTAITIKDNNFSLVHLDVDLYQSTKDCLEFFYERMISGGIILSHDYDSSGVKKAFDEFFFNKSEKVIRLPLSQCMTIKG
ncbi:macrocin-O-methyltransferase [Candidatus Pacearchaeota archaeon]|nr:macrocin-O-methyltransferase [Candidatus Pacearchaeota archaeon]